MCVLHDRFISVLFTCLRKRRLRRSCIFARKHAAGTGAPHAPSRTLLRYLISSDDNNAIEYAQVKQPTTNIMLDMASLQYT